MTDEKDKELPLVHNIWSRLMFSAAQNRKAKGADKEDKNLVLSAVERQTENSRKGGTIWEAVRKADEDAFKCPVHMLFLYGTETHLNMARYLIAHFPYTITQIYNQPVN
jgi:hypothetical protein